MNRRLVLTEDYKIFGSGPPPVTRPQVSTTVTGCR
jgi:hypothetical protein